VLRPPAPAKLRHTRKVSIDSNDFFSTEIVLFVRLPILQLLSKDPFGVFALVLTPTRELALQIREQFLAFGRPMGVRCIAIIGGIDGTAQLVSMGDNPHIIVATPGRLIDHLRIHRNDLHFNRLRFLVLDEADRLLAAQFQAPLTEILGALPPSNARQTLYYSATMTPSLDRLQAISETVPFRFDFSPLQPLAVVRDVTQRFVCSPESAKVCFLVYALRLMLEKNPKNQAIVFTSTCRRAQQLFVALTRLRIDASPLHSMLPQSQRTKSLEKLRRGNVNVLCATDVASRGLDIAAVSLVVHLDMPPETASYVHRTGRTARAGRTGESLAIVTQEDLRKLHAFEAKIGLTATEWVVQNDQVRYHIRESITAWRLANAMLADSGFDDRAARRKNPQVKRSQTDGEDAKVKRART
jgi:ATP-dependent RNA helicase DDX49/DBP8